MLVILNSSLTPLRDRLLLDGYPHHADAVQDCINRLDLFLDDRLKGAPASP